MRYKLVIWDRPDNREILFNTPLYDERAVIETGSAWLRRFPTDIVMVVELEGASI